MKVNFVPKQKFVSFMPDFNQAPIAPPAPKAIEAPPIHSVDLEPISERESLADEILKRGLDSSPTRGGIGEGFARLGQAFLGGYLKNKAQEALTKAKDQNKQSLMDAFKRGDIGEMLTSDSPIGQKLGAALVEQKLKKRTGSYKTLDDGTVVWEEDDGGPPSVISRPTTGIPAGYRRKDDDSGYEFIPGGPADPAVIQRDAGKRRAPPKVTPDQSGIAPWNRKW